MKNELPNYNKKVGGYVVFNKDGKTAITNDGTKGGYFYGDSHQDPSNGISAIVDNDRPILVEGNEVIINKKTVQSEKVLTVKGTPKEILSTLNQMDGNGVAIGDEEAEILAKYRTGGSIPREKQMYLGKEGGSNVSPKGMFESAVQMENEGIDSETIRSITGWFRSDLDGLWRYEISDNEMEIICTFTDKEINHLKTKNNYIQRHLKDVIKHEELFKAYPRIKYLKVLFVDSNNSDVALLDVSNEGVMFIICNLKYEREISDNRGGTKELGEREISDNRRSGEERKAKRYNTLHFRKVITHELQHAIQINEGLAEGGNPNIELKKIKTDSGAIQSLTEKEQEYIATQRYLNKAGEIEAMSSDVRINLDDLQRIRNKPYSEIAIDPKYFSSDLETKIKFREGGELIKRADGSYSRRGLWDNIRDNVGSGRKPTKQMLEQEAKIKSKYHLGGDMTKHLAPNGKPSNLTHEQWHLVRTPEFKAWFGDWENEPANSSEVVDENGEPKIMYHGSRGDFNIFSNENENKLSWTEGGLGFYFTSNYNSALGYGRRVISTFINSRAIKKSNETEHAFVNENNLYKLRKSGFDSIYFDGEFTNTRGQRSFKDDELVVFNPNQIKLADGTNTTFDSDNDDIRFAEGGKIAPNGKKSNLTTEQYKLVRTDAFKNWFGDWENDPKNSSKVVDKNGEPLILFQGQAYSKYPKGNYIFDKDNQGIFFTSSKKIANTYGNVIQVFVNARNLKDIRNYYGYDNKKISEDKRNVSRWTSKYKFSELINYVNSDENVVDFYEGIIDKYGDKITINTSREDIVLKDKKALKDFIVPMSPEGFKYVNHTYKSAIWDLVAKYVRASNYDGIICTDEDNNREDRADTFIVYNSNQVKLADGTNTTLDSNNPDIRFEKGG